MTANATPARVTKGPKSAPVFHPNMTAAAIVALDQLVGASSVQHVLAARDRVSDALGLGACVGRVEYLVRMRQKLVSRPMLTKFSKVHAILHKLDKRRLDRQYGANRAMAGQRALVIGGGISGLRVAIELLLLGADVVCVEKRDAFTRNNVIHLWPNVIADMRAMGAKRFYGQFCVGAIDHIAIRQLQLILLKVALLCGLDFRPRVHFRQLCARQQRNDACDPKDCVCCCHGHGLGDGATAHLASAETGADERDLSSRQWDVIVGSDGRRNTLWQDFPRKEFRGKLAIAITANFVRRRSEAETRAAEISGVSYIYHQKWFESLRAETGIQLENICYYCDETHYFVMTATKASLLARGVLRRDFPETAVLLDASNVNRDELLRYASDAAHWTTGLRDLEFARNGSQAADVALFDFTSVYAARNASRARLVDTTCCSRERRAKHVLMLLTGDSLLEPFWPTGSGAGRGFLSALDAAYTALRWTQRVVPLAGQPEAEMEAMVDVLAERESVYRLLAQTTPENISAKDVSSLLPQNRYKKWTKNAIEETRLQVRHLIGRQLVPSVARETMAAKRARRATVAVTSRHLKDESQFERQTSEETTPMTTSMTTVDDTEEARVSTSLARKADWLLGSTGGSTRRPTVGQPVEAIAERALDLESKMFCTPFVAKLEKVGKIDEKDWNFRVWNEPKVTRVEPKKTQMSRAILESRRQQIERKLKPEVTSEAEKRADGQTSEWVRRMRDQLSRRMAPEVTPKDVSSSVPTCVRCECAVTGLEKISICGRVLHRSCLRCQKCGIGLRLNEFRADLQFFCVFCLSRVKAVDEKQMRAKELFLKNNQKIDFRQKDEELEIISKTALNAESAELELSFGSGSDVTTSDDSDDWVTESEDETTSDDTRDDKTTEPTTNIPSICVTSAPPRPDAPPKYSGAFTEKLFRSRSQPLIAWRRPPAAPPDDSDSEPPFADWEDALDAFSPLRASLAPLIRFDDI